MKKRKIKKKILFILYSKPAILILISFLLVFVAIFISFFFSGFSSSFVSPLPSLQKALGVTTTQNPSHLLKSELASANIVYKEISYPSPESARIVLESGEEVLFSLRKDIEYQVSSLQLIRQRTTIEGKSFQKLDLRYEKPLIVFK